MGSIWHLYYVPLETLTSFWGTRDDPLVDAIYDKYIADVLDEFYDEDEKQLDFRKVLKDIASSRSDDDIPAEHYGYTLEYICKFFGYPVDMGNLEECSLEWYDEIGIMSPLFEGTPPIPIPVTGYGDPLIGHFTFEQIQEQLELLKQYDSDDSNLEVSDRLTASRQNYYSWLKEAKSGDAIVSFLF